MGYLIELSINIKKNTNISELKETVKTLAKKYNCSFMYDSYEYIVNNRYYFRNHCIITMEFPDDDANLISFINSIKKNKKVHIEMLSYENLTYSLMYASKKYLNLMEKEEAKSYLKLKYQKNTFKYDSDIMKLIRKR
tara:strand:- start:78 stop:488 length:411 start_codon:yes stop_codon:yes gene_type:complete